MPKREPRNAVPQIRAVCILTTRCAKLCIGSIDNMNSGEECIIDTHVGSVYYVFSAHIFRVGVQRDNCGLLKTILVRSVALDIHTATVFCLYTDSLYGPMETR